MENKEKIEEHYKQLQLLNENIQQLQKHMEMIEGQVTELKVLQHDLDTLKDVKAGSEILVTLSNGVFVPATIGDPNKLVVNVGASTLTQKNIPNVQQLMDTQVEELQQLQQRMLDDLKKMVGQATELEGTLKQLVS